MSDDNRQRRFKEGMERLYGYPGYGPWSAKLWICGAEERGPTGDFNDEWVLNGSHADNEQPPFVPDEKDRTSPAWRLAFQLASQTVGCTKGEDPWAFGEQWCEKPDLLHLTNMFVLPRQNTRDWKLKLLSREEFKAGIREKRVPILRERRLSSSVVVCHCVKETREFGRAAFVQEGDVAEIVEADDGRSFELYSASRTILCPFFRPTMMTNALFGRLCQEVGKLLATTNGPRYEKALNQDLPKELRSRQSLG
jgi:hypothetical protein